MKLEYLELDALEEEVKKLPPSHQIAFAASICERLLPNYYIFALESNWDTSSLLRTALDEVWLFLEGKSLDEARLRQLIIDCENVIPHDHDNNLSGYVSIAQYAAAAVCYALELCLECNSKFVKQIAYDAHETLWAYLFWQQEVLDDEWDEKYVDSEQGIPHEYWSDKSFKEQVTIIANHPFVVKEMAKENQDLQTLKETAILTKEFLQVLRNCSCNDGKSLIGLSEYETNIQS